MKLVLLYAVPRKNLLQRLNRRDVAAWEWRALMNRWEWVESEEAWFKWVLR